jgi:hypothetical protein
MHTVYTTALFSVLKILLMPRQPLPALSFLVLRIARISQVLILKHARKIYKINIYQLVSCLRRSSADL